MTWLVEKAKNVNQEANNMIHAAGGNPPKKKKRKPKSR
jgi:hypothetical protein